jgi:hypothetical protein
VDAIGRCADVPCPALDCVNRISLRIFASWFFGDHDLSWTTSTSGICSTRRNTLWWQSFVLTKAGGNGLERHELCISGTFRHDRMP